MSSAGTVNGRGFGIGGYNVTVDSTDVATCTVQSNGNGGGLSNKTANGSHLFFTSKIALAFKTGTIGLYSATVSGSMKYILGT